MLVGISVKKRLVVVAFVVCWALLMLLTQRGETRQPDQRRRRASTVAGKGTEREQPSAAVVPRDEINGCFDVDEVLRHWMDQLHARGKLVGKRWTVVDVGANKGYGISSILEALGEFEHNTDYLALSLLTYATKFGPFHSTSKSLCGICCECDPPPLRNVSTPPHGGIELWGYDGMSSLVDFLRLFFRSREAQGDRPSVHFNFKAAAVADTAGRAMFQKTFFGSEVASLVGNSSATNRNTGNEGYKQLLLDKAEVPQVTLDADLGHLPNIDVLLTDTEGWDFNVAMGAAGLLLSGRVSLYAFEIHEVANAVSQRRLGTHLRWLEGMGFTCYWPISGFNVRHRLVSLSRGNWQEAYDDYRGWRNVVCSHRSAKELEDAMAVMSAPLNEPVIRGKWNEFYGGCGNGFRERYPFVPFS